MNPGTILFHKNFQFKDGSTGDKLLILLTPQIDSHFYVAVKTTSKAKHKGTTRGCQHTDRHPNFYIPNGTSSFRKDTWIILDEFYELRSTELLQRHFSGDIESIDTLDKNDTIALLECAILSDDISSHQENSLKQALQQLKTPPFP